MAEYTVRPGFTIFQNNEIYQGGDLIHLDSFEYGIHKHKLEGVGSTIDSIPIQDRQLPSIFEAVRTLKIEQDLVLTNSDFKFQNLINKSGSRLNVFLPDNPVIHCCFVLIVDSTSSDPLLFNQIEIRPGERHGLIFDGNNWKKI